MFKRISVAEAQDMMSPADGVDGDVQVVDIRDEDSYARAHIPGAMHLHNSNIQEFIMEADPERPVIVCCRSGTVRKYLGRATRTDATSHFNQHGAPGTGSWN